MKSQTRLFLLFGIGAWAGCSPLQQAPLVYSSKVIVGMDISANASESPGASVNIGVKSVDAAYVPIAVSKAIDANTKRTDETTIGILQIYAMYGVDDSGSSSKDLTETNKTKIVAYLEAWKAESAAQESVKSTKGLYDGAATRLDQLKSMKRSITSAKQSFVVVDTSASAPASGTDYRNAIEALNKQLTNIDFNGPYLSASSGAYNFDQVLEELDDSISTGENGLPAQKAAYESAQQKLLQAKQLADDKFAAAAQAASLVNTKKTDALSVYGRFDSNGTAAASTGGAPSAPSTNGSVLVGKVFSTGLASQNLTEAVKIEARTKCVTITLGLAASLSDEDKKALLAKVDRICLIKSPGEVGQ